MLLRFDRQIFNVVHLGLCFLVMFSADFTVTNMQKTINTSVSQDKPEYNVDGYISLGLVYMVYGLVLWLAPSLVAVVGAKLSMLIGAICITIFMFSLMLEKVYVTYIGIIFGGIGGSFLWVAEGHYLVLNSDTDTMSRNVGLFWFLYTASLISGNLYAVFQLEGKTRLDYHTRQQLLQVLSGLGVLACIMFALLGSPKRHTNEQPINHEGPIEALMKTWHLFRSKEILILLITFCYGGFQQSFGAGIYSPSLGFTQKFGIRAKQLVPLSGLIYGLGDSMGGLVNMLLLKTGLIYPKRYVIFTGLLLQTAAYCIIYINIPNEAVFGETNHSAIIQPTIWLALMSSFLIGVGDSCLNTQIYPLIAALHPNYSAHTCALYKFSKSMAMATFFFCSPSLGLHIQLIMLFILGIAGTAAFAWVDMKEISTNKENTSCDVT